MELARTSQLVMVIGLAGVQFCNHTSDLLIKSMITTQVDDAKSYSQLIINDAFRGP